MWARCRCKKGSVSLVGDVLLRTGSEAYAAIAADAFSAQKLLGRLLDRVQAADVLFFNQEGAIADAGERRDAFYPEHFYIRAGGEALTLLSSFNRNQPVASLANNHIADFGIAGMEKTKVSLEAAGVRTVGLGTEEQLDDAPVVEVAGARIAFLAFTDLLPASFFAQAGKMGAFRLTETNLKRAIAAAKSNADLIVVSLHTVANIASRFTELPDHTQTRFAHIAADAGAHLVIGHQPHGVQYVERRSRGLIFHSLGAFIYNPNTSSIYPKGHPFHFGTQFYGGSILELFACKHGFTIKRLTPTRCVLAHGTLRVVTGTLRQKIKAWSFLLLS